jgi:Na+/H+ antiporter NhaC
MTGNVEISVAIAGVVFSGSIFGDHCSPISDTTVLSSIFSGADHIDHVTTQIPYALTVAGVTGLMFLLYGFFQISPLVLIALGLVAMVGIVLLLANISENKLNILTIPVISKEMAEEQSS